MSMSETSVSVGPESKYYKMKQLINAIHLYFQTKREDIVVTINMHLQSLSVIIDLSVFDPHSNIAPQFFVTLYDLMNKMEQNLSFAWNCVDVLTNVCRNPAARQALIHTYQFIPSLSRLLSDYVSNDKKTRLLRLMQDLTCGIKISWQIPHLPHLMVTLSKWIESSNIETVTLSMGILVNLCYKNLPAIYTLIGNVDVKKILQVCSAMKGPTIEVHTCKLLIILDYMNGDIPENILSKLFSVTFESVTEAFCMRDTILLRQIVEFFLDVGKQNSFQFLVNNNSCSGQIKQLLQIIQNNHSMETGDSTFENRDPECISVVLEFLNFLIQIKLPAITELYPGLIQLALKWIHTDLVSWQALMMLKCIAVNVDKNDNIILEPLVQGLPIFLTTVDINRNEEGPDYLEHNLKMAGMLQLLKIMAQVPKVRLKILEELKLATICKIFGPLRDVDGSLLRSNDLDVANIETVNLYIHGLALVNELAKDEHVWRSLQSDLMQNRQMHLVLAQCLCQSTKEEKTLVFDMVAITCFPRSSVAEVMGSIQTVSASSLKRTSSHSIQDASFPVMSVPQVKKIDSLLGKLREGLAQREFTSILTSDVIELYEYKLTSMGSAERVALASVEAASEHCTNLQHRNAQLTAELNRSHQLLYRVQQSHEQVSKLKDSLGESVEALKKQVECDKGKLRSLKSQLTTKEDEFNECRTELDSLRKKYQKCSESKKDVEEQNAQLKQLITKLEESSTKLQKALEKREETLRKTNCNVDTLHSKVTELEANLTQKQNELQKTIVELNETSKELNVKKQILETITKYALNSQVSEQSCS